MENDIRIEKLEASIERIDKKQNKIMFYLPSVPQASGGVGVVYSHAKILHDLGHDVIIMHDDKDYIKPTWLGKEYCDLKHSILNNKAMIYPEDIFIYPESFSDLMKKTANLTCIKIVLCQSWSYVLPSLLPKVSWNDLGVKNVLVVQKPLQEYLESIFGQNTLNIKILSPSIDETIFKDQNKIRKPIIAVSARDQQDLLRLAKHFYSAYPQYQQISFRDMRDLSRKDFADTLNECMLGVWIDREAGFGTFPIECAKTGTPFVALIPDMIPEYAIGSDDIERGIWTSSILNLPSILAQFVGMWLEDVVKDEIMESILPLKSEYTKKDEIINVEAVYSGYMIERKKEIIKAIELIKKEDEK